MNLIIVMTGTLPKNLPDAEWIPGAQNCTAVPRADALLLHCNKGKFNN